MLLTANCYDSTHTREYTTDLVCQELQAEVDAVFPPTSGAPADTLTEQTENEQTVQGRFK